MNLHQRSTPPGRFVQRPGGGPSLRHAAATSEVMDFNFEDGDSYLDREAILPRSDSKLKDPHHERL